MRIFSVLLFSFFFFQSSAQKIFGTVFTDKGDLLPYASITVKGTSIGTSANTKAKFILSLSPGTYTIVCQHINYTTVEKTVTVEGETEVTFILGERKLLMKEVVIKAGEDPAYEIIRQAIKKRPYYNSQVKAFDCDLYSKDIIKMRHLPERVFGKKIPEQDRKGMGLDSSGQGILYLSESISKIYTKQPDKFKMNIISSRVSGSNSFGFTFPAFISMYKNNVTVFTEKLNPRGFISPIADGALRFYKYKFLGSFVENGKLVNSIKVIPKRTYEPLFSGVINITEDDWRIHSFDLILTKTSQLEILDTLQIRQQHVPVGGDVWQVQNQFLYFDFNFLKVDMVGTFLTVYSNYNINPVYEKKIFDNVIIKYDSGVTKRTKLYWDSIRPVPLEREEQKDYQVKDSTFKAQMDSAFSKRNIDSLNKRQGKLHLYDIFIAGISRTHFGKKIFYQWGIESLIKHTNYNTAEGIVTELAGYYDGRIRRKGRRILIEPTLRYGFSNTHLNGWATITVKSRDFGIHKKIKRQTWTIAGGKRVSQYNQDNPVIPLINTISTLLYAKNYMKIYENYFGNLKFNKRYESGLNFTVGALYEDRIPLKNTTYATFKSRHTVLEPNFPFERVDSSQVFRHQAVIASVELSYKPGQRFIQFPNYKVPIGSKFPTFTFSYTKGINGVLDSDVDFDKWSVGVFDDKNLKLAGTIKYKFSVGGFLNRKKVYIQDFQHFNGNRFRTASEYVNSFQLAKYYANSTTASIYALAHVEHHFNGLFTNKIPLFKRLNWNMVGGANAFYVNSKSNYTEVFIGIENIFKIFRIDFVAAYENGKVARTGFVIGGGGLLGGNIKTSNSSATMRGRTVEISF